jgi:hypothetical protein
MDTTAEQPLTFLGKIAFAGKLIVFIVTFGFAFPLLLSKL